MVHKSINDVAINHLTNIFQGACDFTNQWPRRMKRGLTPLLLRTSTVQKSTSALSCHTFSYVNGNPQLRSSLLFFSFC